MSPHKSSHLRGAKVCRKRYRRGQATKNPLLSSGIAKGEGGLQRTNKIKRFSFWYHSRPRGIKPTTSSAKLTSKIEKAHSSDQLSRENCQLLLMASTNIIGGRGRVGHAADAHKRMRFKLERKHELWSGRRQGRASEPDEGRGRCEGEGSVATVHVVSPLDHAPPFHVVLLLQPRCVECLFYFTTQNK